MFRDPSKLLTPSKIKYIWGIWESGINLKEVKSSSEFKIYYSLNPKNLTEHPEQFELWNLQNFGWSMGHIKIDCENIFNIKKTHSIYHSNPFFSVFHICHSVFNLHRGVEWVGIFLKNSQKRGGGNHLKFQWFFMLFS